MAAIQISEAYNPGSIADRWRMFEQIRKEL